MSTSVPAAGALSSSGKMRASQERKPYLVFKLHGQMTSPPSYLPKEERKSLKIGEDWDSVLSGFILNGSIGLVYPVRQ